MLRQLSPFEAKAHDIQYRKRNRQSFPLFEEVDIAETKDDRVAFMSVLVIVTLVIVALIKL